MHQKNRKDPPHLTTRPPLEMSLHAFGRFLTILLLAPLVGCAQTSSDSSESKPPAVVEGQVFISTESGRTLNLADRPVYAIEQSSASQFIDSLTNARRARVDTLAKKVGALARRADRIVEDGVLHTDRSEMEKGLLDTLEQSVGRLLRPSPLRHFWEGIPPAADTARTGPDGRYTLQLQKGESYYLTSLAQRKLGGGFDAPREKMLWMKGVSPTADTVAQDLSNSNLGFYYREFRKRGPLADSAVVLYTGEGVEAQASRFREAVAGRSFNPLPLKRMDRDWGAMLRLAALDPDSLDAMPLEGN